MKIRKIGLYITLLSAMFYLFTSSVVSYADDKADRIRELTIERAQCAATKASKLRTAGLWQEHANKVGKEIADLQPSYNEAKTAYDQANGDLQTEINKRTWAAYDIDYAGDMLESLSGESASNPAIQYWTDVRDEARNRYYDADAEVKRLQPIVDGHYETLRPLQNKMDKLNGKLTKYLNKVSQFETDAQDLQDRIDEIDIELEKLTMEDR